jgi:hypothetical protein
MKPLKFLLAVITIIIPLMTCSLTLAQPDGIKPGDSIEGELTSDTPIRAYTFVGEAGSWLKLTTESTDFIPVMIIENSAGSEIARSDSSGVPYADLYFSATENNPYTINVASYDDSRGSFALSITRIGPTPLKTDEAATIKFEEIQKYFQIDAKNGDTYSISVTLPGSSAFTPLEVYSASGKEIARGIDIFVTDFPYLAIPEDGSYLVVVTGDEAEPGQSSLTIKPTEVAILTDQPQTLVMGYNLSETSFIINAGKPGIYRLIITLDASPEDTDPNGSINADLQRNGSTFAYLRAGWTGRNGKFRSQ